MGSDVSEIEIEIENLIGYSESPEIPLFNPSRSCQSVGDGMGGDRRALPHGRLSGQNSRRTWRQPSAKGVSWRVVAPQVLCRAEKQHLHCCGARLLFGGTN
jgi:hypothetical protein